MTETHPAEEQTATSRPSHKAYAVTKGKNGDHWQEIGALWPHKDGKGFKLKLNFLPLPAGQADIVIREAKEGSSSAPQATAA